MLVRTSTFKNFSTLHLRNLSAIPHTVQYADIVCFLSVVFQEWVPYAGKGVVIVVVVVVGEGG